VSSTFSPGAAAAGVVLSELPPHAVVSAAVMAKPTAMKTPFRICLTSDPLLG
jgi:hypothetical protein